MITMLFASAASAQEFAQGGIADPREPRIAIGFLRSDLFSDPLEARPGQELTEYREWDTHGVVQLGVTRPIFRIGNVTGGIQGGAIARFRLDTSDNDALSVDYMIAMPIAFTLAGTQTRVRLIHRSAHLGDEVVLNSGLRRLEFDHEEIDIAFRRNLGHGTAAYIAGTKTLASSFDWDDGGVQAGIEGRWPVSGKWRIVAAADWQRHAITHWTDQFNVVAGVEGEIQGWTARLEGRLHTGATHLGEFFLDREKAWGTTIILGW